MATTKKDLTKDIIVLRSVYGKVNQKYYIMPCKNPQTGRFPDCVKSVDSHGDMILTDAERNSKKHFIKETDVFVIEDGKTFDLSDEIQKAQWEAIEHCPYIAPSREAKDDAGNNLIDGTMGWSSRNPRYGQADLYIDRPGEAAQHKIKKTDLYRSALNYIFDDPKGSEGRLLICKLLGHRMDGLSDSDVQDYLISVAEKNPKLIIDTYSGDDTALRLLLVEAKDKKVIYYKSKLFMYADNIVLGATEDAVLTWMRDPKNKKTLELIRKDTFPDLYPES